MYAIFHPRPELSKLQKTTKYNYLIQQRFNHIHAIVHIHNLQQSFFQSRQMAKILHGKYFKKIWKLSVQFYNNYIKLQYWCKIMVHDSATWLNYKHSICFFIITSNKPRLLHSNFEVLAWRPLKICMWWGHKNTLYLNIIDFHYLKCAGLQINGLNYQACSGAYYVIKNISLAQAFSNPDMTITEQKGRKKTFIHYH